jgi:hypothetical protein
MREGIMHTFHLYENLGCILHTQKHKKKKVNKYAALSNIHQILTIAHIHINK